MKLTDDQVIKVANLANLPLEQSDIKIYAKQLSAILEYFDQIEKIDTKDIEPLYNTTGLSNIFAPDQSIESLSQEEALTNASYGKDDLPEAKKGYFITKGVFKE